MYVHRDLGESQTLGRQQSVGGTTKRRETSIYEGCGQNSGESSGCAGPCLYVFGIVKGQMTDVYRLNPYTHVSEEEKSMQGEGGSPGIQRTRLGVSTQLSRETVRELNDEWGERRVKSRRRSAK